MLTLTPQTDGWHARWRPSLLFPQLGDGATLALQPHRGPARPDPRRRRDGLRGDAAGRDARLPAGVACRPDDRLRGAGHRGRAGRPCPRRRLPGRRAAGPLAASSREPRRCCAAPRGWRSRRPRRTATPVPILERPMVPGADLTITIRPSLQATAEAALTNHNDAATVVLDPKTGDVWALASAPRFNPNSMTLGTTLAGQPLAPGHGVGAAQPGRAGGASRRVVVQAVHPDRRAGDRGRHAQRRACPASAPGATAASPTTTTRTTRSAAASRWCEAMAFSCNTTYMPLAIRVWEAESSCPHRYRRGLRLRPIDRHHPPGRCPRHPARCPLLRHHAARQRAPARRTGRPTRSSSRSGRATSGAPRSSWPTPTPPSRTAGRSGCHAW